MAHKHNHTAVKNLKTAFFLNIAFTIIEIIGGLYVNSVAILSDAVHDLGDSLSLGTSWFLQRKSEQKADQKFSFGYGRFSLVGALINSIVLIAGSVYVIYEAVGRFMEPEHSNAVGMMYFAIGGVVVNGIAAWKLYSGKTMNERVVSWHLIEDVLGWFAVLVVAVILQFKEILYLDPALSLIITLYVLWNVLKRLKETFFIFLQGQPKSIDTNRIENEIVAIENVVSVHHTHVWSIDGDKNVFTIHVKLGPVNSLAEYFEIKKQIKRIVSKYRFNHCTIETELSAELCGLETESFEKPSSQ